MRNFFSKFFCPHFIDLEISLFCKQTGPRYVNKWLKQISLPFLYSPWIVETHELCHKKWPDFYLKLSRSISVKMKNEEYYKCFLSLLIWQIMNCFAGSKSWVQTFFFWRVYDKVSYTPLSFCSLLLFCCNCNFIVEELEQLEVLKAYYTVD